ncbi:MAG: hypothetical protein IJT62_06025 [Oscillospiraceae bacterium]|nr:hypothetical protein [Oscillospiraceae bacterium]
MNRILRRGCALLLLAVLLSLFAGCLPAVQAPAPAAPTAAPSQLPALVLLTPEPETFAAAETASPEPTAPPEITASPAPTPAPIAEDGYYYSRDEVALYIHTYGRLPGNFITKREAQALGWTGGNVEAYAPKKAIGGDVFGNYEGLLPWARGRTYYECDIDTLGYRDRGSRRIVYSNDGLIYYTGNHYKTFTLLYGEE